MAGLLNVSADKALGYRSREKVLRHAGTDLKILCGHKHSEHALCGAECMVPVVIRHAVPVTTSHCQDPLAQTLQG